jgi:hypothetical protein
VSVTGLALGGTAAGNYVLSSPAASAAIGTITPRSLTITAEDLSRLFGQTNPSLTFAITSGTLVAGNMLTGAPVTAAALDSPSGTYPITQGTLAASANYTITFIDGLLVVLPSSDFGASPVKYAPPSPSTGSSSKTGLTPCSPASVASTLQSQGSAMIFDTAGGACGNL